MSVRRLAHSGARQGHSVRGRSGTLERLASVLTIRTEELSCSMLDVGSSTEMFLPYLSQASSLFEIPLRRPVSREGPRGSSVCMCEGLEQADENRHVTMILVSQVEGR